MKLTRRSVFSIIASLPVWTKLGLAQVTSPQVVASAPPADSPIQRGRLSMAQREAMKRLIANQSITEALILDGHLPLHEQWHLLPIPEAVQKRNAHARRILRESLEQIDSGDPNSNVIKLLSVMIPRPPHVIAEADVLPHYTEYAISKETAIQVDSL